MTEPTEQGLHELVEDAREKPTGWTITHAYVGPTFQTAEGHEYGVCIRDDTIEVTPIGDAPLPRIMRAAPATCPTCGSDDPKVRGHQHYLGGVGLGGRFCLTDHGYPEGMTPESCFCSDSFHATPTPVSDDAVREALARLRTLRAFDDVEVREFSETNGSCFHDVFESAVATLEAAIHQRDERIGELTERLDDAGEMLRGEDN